ncbi:hypothetical protein NM688_g4246 [Phlebia brevispora]|uniref:Uncharacterized protein n=1 Tax=Phlebia brevispora TaxID=194682 RepID=A0ACC1T364_9APHY|nr:hypothetical protein NM688_g4246 [Phlebia brevispora]
MSSTHPEDEPFDHEAVIRHDRADSTTNLLNYSAGPSSSGLESGKDGFYENEGPSKPSLYDPEKLDAQDEQIDLSRDRKYEDLDYSDELYNESRARPMREKATPFSRLFGNSDNLQQRIERKKRGIGKQKYPFPVVNPMLGPSQSALIHAGARFPPCMKTVQGLTPSTSFACLNDTANPPDRLCPLEDVCGLGGFHNKEPNQWFRFITPVFLHAGIIHILLNMLAQCTASAEVEREMGSGGFLILYLAAGIFGNVLGGNFALVASPSVGASGAIFGTVAVAWIDLFAHWKYQYRPVRKLLWMIVEFVIGIAVGYIPYVDNFAHIGGFLMGLLVGMVFYPIISTTKRHKVIVWTCRIAAIPLAVVLYVVLLRNFYKSDPMLMVPLLVLLPNVIQQSLPRNWIYYNYHWNKHLEEDSSQSRVLDRVDPLHCQALLSRGRWLDDKFRNWQPQGCMLYNYQPADISYCLGSRHVVFVGDSVTRQLYFQFLHSMDSALPSAPPDDEHKHMDYSYMSAQNVQLSFHWDPFLNSSAAQTYIHGAPGIRLQDKPALLVLGSGLWYLRYAESGGLPVWESMMEGTVNGTQQHEAADLVVILPVEDVVPSKLSPDRAASMHGSDIDAMNSDLSHRVRPPFLDDPFSFTSSGGSTPPALAFPSVFNLMLDPTQTDDGLHFSDAVVQMQARILMNLRCNDVLPKVFPHDKTCCRSYPWPTLIHLVILVATLIYGPVSWFLLRRSGNRPSEDALMPKAVLPAVTISASVAAIYLADRTGFWLKEQKQFNPYTFTFLSLLSLAIGLLTMRRADNDLGFLNRDQTDEWKGWMQIAILIYHYTGASKISPIYNPIRVLVASYLFMTGYGHTTFYLKKADFGFPRVAQVLVRLNLYTLILAYTMNTDYISYYFSPLVSWWYLIIYATMVAGARFNERSAFLICKILLSMSMVAFIMRQDWLLKAIFMLMERFFGIHWSAREWAFRVNLDICIVYVGMLSALAVIKFREHRIADHPRWPVVVKVSVGTAALVIVWYLFFEMSYNKFEYNIFHPFISFLPVGAFIILRNASSILRSASSKAFAFIGKCSLETFVIQYHFWLAGDTKGILVIIPGARWGALNMLVTTIMFIYVSDCVAHATGELTKWICGDKLKTNPTLPMPVATTARPAVAEEDGTVQEVIFLAPADLSETKDENSGQQPLEPDTPVRPVHRWADRLAEGTSPSGPRINLIWRGTEWRPGVKTKLLFAMLVMWVLNVLWVYPPRTA